MEEEVIVDARALREDALSGGERAARAFGRLWSVYYRRLSAYAASFRGLPRGEREDAVAEALVSAFSRLESYDPGRPLSSWVYAIAHNRFADEARRARRLSPVEVEAAAGPREGEGPPDGAHAEAIVSRLSDAELEAACAAAIAELPELDRRVVALSFLEGLDSAEVGRVLGMAPGTVRWRIHRIRARVAGRVGGRP